MNFRLATWEDSALLFWWRNDPLTRMMSHNTLPITMDEHEAWLKKSLTSVFRKIYIAEEIGNPVGTVRIDTKDDGFELSWTIAPEYRHQGKGKEMVALIADRIVAPLHAEVKPENIASRKMAESIGMRIVKETPDMLYYKR